jgi:hypothetical protein
MSERGKKHAAGGSHGLHEQAARATVQRDPKSSKLLGAGKALGNEELQSRIQKGSASRDEMLALVVQRLGAMREAQRREVDASDLQSMRKDNLNRVTDGKKLAEIDPTKWHLPARLYEQAVFHLCRGALRQGAQAMEKAISEEKKAFEETPAHVQKDGLEIGLETPAAAAEIGVNQSAAACDVPAGVERLIDEILTVGDVEDDATVKMRNSDPWWTDEEEEEEEKPDGKPAGQ